MPTHGGRPPSVPIQNGMNGVSTHAHARWATISGRHTPRQTFGFNPRPRTVGDHIDGIARDVVRGFNPRPRTVGDR